MEFENMRNLREDCDKKRQEIADYLHIKQTTYSKIVSISVYGGKSVVSSG